MQQFLQKLLKTSGLMTLLIAGSQNCIFAQVRNIGSAYITGTVYIGTSSGGAEALVNDATANYLNAGNLYLTGDFTNNQLGMLASSSSTPITNGTIHFIGSTTSNINGSGPLNFYNMEMSKSAAAIRVDMAQNVTTVYNLLLTKGIVTTGSYLFTWGNTGGSITSPGTNGATYGESGSGTYVDSYIATCDASGTPNTGGATSTVRFPGNVGMRINNVSAADVFFPVGVSWKTAEVGSLPSPNKLMIHNYGTAQAFTVALDYGDIGNTPGLTSPKVNRIWYINPSDTNATTHASDVRLFYTKRDWTSGGGSGWPSTENEVETGFNYGKGALAQKNYTTPGIFVNLSKDPSGDIITSFAGAANGSEIYAQYTSISGPNSTTRITSFDRFSIVNPSGLILPVTIINFKAYQQGSGVETQWTCVNEKNMDHYEVQHATNGIDFSSIGSVVALNNGQTSLNYNFYDAHPANGNNFYRIKAVSTLR